MNLVWIQSFNLKKSNEEANFAFRLSSILLTMLNTEELNGIEIHKRMSCELTVRRVHETDWIPFLFGNDIWTLVKDKPMSIMRYIIQAITFFKGEYKKISRPGKTKEWIRMRLREEVAYVH